MFDLDEYDPGIELISELVPGVIWRFGFDGDISMYHEGHPGGARSLCYYFTGDGDQLPGADNIIAAALLAVTDEKRFAVRILQSAGNPQLKIQNMLDLPNN